MGRYNNKLVGIQILRILSCLSVFIVHFGQRMRISESLPVIYNITYFGRYGVQMFFLISGFLICLSLDKCSVKRDYMNYYKKKAIRLLPLYYFVILWYFIYESFLLPLMGYASSIPDDPIGLGWLRYIFLLNGFIGYDGYFWSNLGITWTIPIFAFAYLVAPLILKFVKKFWHSVFVFLIALVLAVIQTLYLDNNLIVLQCFYIFTLGFMVWFAVKEHKVDKMLLVIGCLWTFLKVLSFKSAISDILGWLEIPIIFALILTAMVQIEMNFPNRIKKTINIMDEYSYTLYLIHGVVFCSILDKFRFQREYVLIIAVFGTLVLTVLSHKFYEKPLTSLLLKKFVKK